MAVRSIGWAAAFFIGFCALAGCSKEAGRLQAAPAVPVKASPPGQSYRFDSGFEGARVTGEWKPEESAQPIFDFETAETKGWTCKSGRSVLRCEGGCLVFDAAGPDSLVSPVFDNATSKQMCSVQIRMSVSPVSSVRAVFSAGAGETFTDGKPVEVPIAAGGEMHAYEIKASWPDDPPASAPACRRFRLDVDGNSRVTVDYARMLPEDAQFARSSAGRMTYALSRKLRTGLFLHTPGAIEYEVDVFPRAFLSVGIGKMGGSAPVSFRITARESGIAEKLLEQTVSGWGWQDFNINLSAYSGKKIALLFEADSAVAGNVALWSSPVMYSGNAAGRPLNVVWYVIDAVRADHLDTYGYARQTAPSLGRLAESGARFARCFSPSTWTKPSVASMLTGVPPEIHQVGFSKLNVGAGLKTLPEILREAGYVTASVTHNPYAPPCANLDRGFDEVVQLRLRDRRDRPGDGESSASAYLDGFVRAHRDRNFFLYVHTIEAHIPYIPPGKFRLFKSDNGEETAMDRYDDGIAWADANLAEFVDTLRQNNLSDSTLLIVCSDHGQSFYPDDGGAGHGGKPYLARVHVPLIMYFPGHIAGGVIADENVQLLDIAPTILDLLGLPGAAQFEGTSLRQLLDGKENAFAGRTVYCLGSEPQWRAAVKDNWFVFADGETSRLYDLAQRWDQKIDVAAQSPGLLSQLEAEITSHYDRQAIAAKGLSLEEEATVIDVETVDQMKALGYMN